MIALRRRRTVRLDESIRQQVDRRRGLARQLVDPAGRSLDRIHTAPAGYLMAHRAADVARHAELLATLPATGEVRVALTPAVSRGHWHLDIGARDRPGLLAWSAGALRQLGIEVVQAVLATWADTAALQAFVVHADRPDEDVIRDALVAHPSLRPVPVPDAHVACEPAGAYTACEVTAVDQRGLLHAIAVAITAAGADIHAARVTTLGSTARDRFDLTDRDARPLDAGAAHHIEAILRRG